MERLSLIAKHLTTKRHDPFKTQGWGYNDTSFSINHRGHVELTGNRYLYSGKELPSFRAWAE